MFSYFILCFLHLAIQNCDGHGNMVIPFVWWDKEQIGMERGMQCVSGFSIKDLPAGPGAGTNCLWFTNDTFIPHSPTLDNSLRTYRDESIPGYGPNQLDYTRHNPWRSPGSAHVHSPCGVAGGNPDGCPIGAPRGEGFDCPGGGWSHGPNAEHYPFSDIPITKWSVGSIVEVAWGIIANHGGGYSYRLCKVPEEGTGYLTEECFQQTPLDFVGEKQWVQYGQDIDSRVEFLANRTNKGTYPKGSQWTKNPIPACYRVDGGFFSPECDELQFPEPAPGLSGFGNTIKDPSSPRFKFHIVDKIQIPSHLEPGNYVISFRWDCEQTPQIWNACGSIDLVDGYENVQVEVIPPMYFKEIIARQLLPNSLTMTTGEGLAILCAVILGVLLFLWLIYCAMYFVVYLQRQRNYENIGDLNTNSIE